MKRDFERVRFLKTSLSNAQQPLHICINQNHQVMKKFLLSLVVPLVAATAAYAQPNPNDLFISGYVTNANGAAVSGQWVCVTYNPTPMITDTVCGTTNANGYYWLTIPNGSVTGPNQTFGVVTYEYCNGAVYTHNESVSNQQGTVDQATVNFTLNCSNSGGGGGCNCSVELMVLQAPNGNDYEFSASVPCGSAPYTYQWWVDGNIFFTDQVTYDFGNIAGAYGVCVTVADANGCTFSSCDTIIVGNGGGNGCTASFQYASNPNGGIEAGTPNQFYFTGNSSDPNNTTYYWTVVGNGMSFTYYGANPSITFPTAGTYNVCATVIDSTAMCADDFCATVTVSGNNTGGCQAYFMAIDSANVAMYFYNQSQGSGLSYLWDFGDGNTSTEQYPWHSYTAVGSYYVCLTVSNGTCSDTYCDTVNFGNGGNICDATFSYGTTPAGGYSFLANSANTLGQFVWNFGDGTTGSGYYVNHNFNEGTYNVCLTMYTSNGTSCTECQTIVVGPQSCTNMITGQVFAGNTNTPVDFATVYLITFDAGTNQLTAVQTAVADSMGYYGFFAPCGDYLVKAATGPNSIYYANHLPTYYGNSPFWNFGQTITVSDVMPGVQYDIVLIAGNNPGGPGFIGGDVTQGANKMDEGDPIANVAVEVFTMSGDAVLYTYTDANGNFSLSDLAYGTYQVYVEVLGVPCTPAIVTLSAENPSVTGLSFYVNSDMISTGMSEVAAVNITGTYPNPATDRLTLGLNVADAQQASVRIADLTGRVVSQSSLSLGAGAQKVTVDVSALNEGIYFISVTGKDGATITQRFMKAE